MVGVAILLALTVASMAVVTAGVGSVVDDAAGSARSASVAEQFGSILPDTGSPGDRVGQLHVGGGTVRSVDRDVRIVGDGGVVFERNVGALVYEHRGRRVTAHAGAVLTGTARHARFSDPPNTVLAPRDRRRSIYLTLPVLTTSTPHDVGGDHRLDLAVNASTQTLTLPGGTYRIAIETTTPAPWNRWFSTRNLSIESDDLDGDGIPSVVATLPPTRAVYVVVIETGVTIRG